MSMAPCLAASLAATLGLAAGLSGCAARRSIEVTSEPTRATVILDERVLGPTPLSIPFTHYGTRLLALQLEGHQVHVEKLAVEPPWYGTFPWDLFSEVLIPVGWEDVHAVHRVLVPGVPEPSEPDLRSVLERAEALRRAGPDGPRRLPPPWSPERPEAPAQPTPAAAPAPDGAPLVP